MGWPVSEFRGLGVGLPTGMVGTDLGASPTSPGTESATQTAFVTYYMQSLTTESLSLLKIRSIHTFGFP